MKQSPYNAMDVANYIVQYYAKESTPINNLLLMMILYYLQVHYLVHNKKLFNEPIEMWGHGPVIHEVYDYFEENRTLPIEKTVTYIECTNDSKWIIVKPNDRKLSKSDEITIINISKPIVNKYRNDPYRLLKIVQNEHMWKKNKTRITSGELHIKYDESEIKQYFSNSKNKFTN